MIFAIFALTMAAIGIYGVTSYAVSQRAGEISIRLALGAEVGKVRRMVLWQGGRIVLLGSVVGLIGAAFLSRLVQSIVFGISALDPLTFLGVPAILVVVGLVANYVPASRATRIRADGGIEGRIEEVCRPRYKAGPEPKRFGADVARFAAKSDQAQFRFGQSTP